MFPFDSSSASSPFSTRSTIASWPEATTNGGDSSKTGQGRNGHPGFPRVTGSEVIQGMHAAFNTFTNGSYPYHANQDFSQPCIPPVQKDIKPSYDQFHTRSSASSRPSTSRTGPSASSSVKGPAKRGGTRSEPPRRLIDTSQVQFETVPLDQLALPMPLEVLMGQLDVMRTKLVIQGDPQIIQKQRVETAIRVILDILLQIPPVPTDAPVHPSLLPFVQDSNANLCSLRRIGSLSIIRLQAGTTTKRQSKKQAQSGPAPSGEIAYLETAVYMSGLQNDGRRVYSCKRCRSREWRRREHKDVTGKIQSNSESDSSSSRIPSHPDAPLPSHDWITGDNPDQYDPQRASQTVQPPPWDPFRPDWRHEIVLFNSAPEVTTKDGSCDWLPLRVVCYGKCHGEKTGFRIRFTLRTLNGRVITTGETNPIKITDDHKTEGKGKPQVEGAPTKKSQPAVPRGRKGRQSAASSRRQSPAPSEGESVQSLSEAGAVLQRQTPSARTGKPYERPNERPLSQSPLHGPLPMECLYSALPIDAPVYRRHHSSSSLHSVASMSALPIQGEASDHGYPAGSAEFPMFAQPHGHGTVSPGNLRRRHFNGFTAMDGTRSHASSAAQSATSSHVSSPVGQYMPLGQGDLYMGSHQLDSPNDLMNALQFASLTESTGQDRSPQAPMVSGFRSDYTDMDMANAVGSGLDDIFDTSSHVSFASSYSDGASGLSAGFPERSLFGEGGLVPENDDMTNFLDFSGGQDQALSPPSLFTGSPNAAGVIAFSPLAQTPSLMSNLLSPVSQPSVAVRPAQIPSEPALNAPVITTVIPAEGPVAGGTTVAIIGYNFSSDTVVLFGGRTAKLERVNPTFIQCLSPPASGVGVAEVTIQGASTLQAATRSYFKYNAMDSDLMRLALQVQEQYHGSSDDVVYRLAQGVAGRSRHSSEWSESSPTSNPSPRDASEHSNGQGRDQSLKENLQTTVVSFISSLDEAAPGSLRRSGAVNHRNNAKQTLLHIGAAMGFHRLVRRLIVIGAHLDSQDLNGYTALSLASLCGQLTCTRVLIEAGASYDRPTTFGEMPMDLAKFGEHRDVEALLLSAVWSTEPEPIAERDNSHSPTNSSEIDNDNPSSGSDDAISHAMRNRRHNVRGHQKARKSIASRTASRRTSFVAPTIPPIAPIKILDDPPPYESPLDPASWMSRTFAHLPQAPIFFPGAVWDRLPIPSMFVPEKAGEHGWIALPAPTWETLQKMTSPEEVMLFTQGMAAAVFKAVVQSGATTTSSPLRPPPAIPDEVGGHGRSRSECTQHTHRTKSESPARKVVKHVKRDRMLYLFWLPILLFVGFWLCVTALPLATGFCLIYARQITRAIKQRM